MWGFPALSSGILIITACRAVSVMRQAVTGSLGGETEGPIGSSDVMDLLEQDQG